MAPVRTCSLYRLPLATGLVVAMPLVAVAELGAQVSGGEVEIVNVRETDPTLGPLVAALIGLGAFALLATMAFWWFTRPSPKKTPEGGRANG